MKAIWWTQTQTTDASHCRTVTRWSSEKENRSLSVGRLPPKTCWDASRYLEEELKSLCTQKGHCKVTTLFPLSPQNLHSVFSTCCVCTSFHMHFTFKCSWRFNFFFFSITNEDIMKGFLMVADEALVHYRKSIFQRDDCWKMLLDSCVLLLRC